MSSYLKTETTFTALPFWQNPQSEPGVKCILPLQLGWDDRGFIKQTTSTDVLKKVVSVYQENSYTYVTAPPGQSVWANRLGADKINFIKKYFSDLNNKRILEIGAGSLYVAELLTKEYSILDYLVIDPSLRESTSNPTIRVVRDYFSQEQCKGEHFDLVICFSVFEHLPDPISFLHDIQVSLSQSAGKAILVFPNVENQFERGDWNVILHEHLNYFTEESSRRIITDCGLEILGSINKFDCLHYLVKAGSLSKKETTYEMDDLLSIASSQFYLNMTHIKNIVIQSLQKGETLAFHGACNGLNHVLHLLDLVDCDHIWIFDGDDTKTGKYLPACKNPILSSTDPQYKTFDKIFIAACTFFSEISSIIMEQHDIERSRIFPLFKKR